MLFGLLRGGLEQEMNYTRLGLLEDAAVTVGETTALGELGDVERAVKVGCDDYLSKPVNKAELLKRVENMLKLRAVTNELERLRRYIDSMEDATSPKQNG